MVKIIFFIEAHFNKRDHERFGIETLIKNGFDVEVWDFTHFLTNPEYRKLNVPDPIEWVGHKVFKDRPSAISAIRGLSGDCFAVSMLSYNFGTLPIYRAISKKKIPYCVQTMALPISENKISRKFVQKLKKFTLKKLLFRIFRVLPLAFFGVEPAALNLATGRKYLSGGLPVNERTEVLWTHSFDHDIYTKEKDAPLSTLGKTAVFLDEYLPFHPDFENMARENPVDAESYYPKLCQFFGAIEKELGLNVVIAAHPRAHYEKKPDLFGGRSVVRGRTGELVRSSEVVILHHSTAINFAILFRKPLIFIQSDSIVKGFDDGVIENPSVSWLASFFGKKVYNLDRPSAIDAKDALSLNIPAYEEYKDRYIKCKLSQDLPSWQIFADRLKRIYA